MSKPPPLPSFYRVYLRTIRQLPHVYLRQFYRLKVRDDIENLRETKSFILQKKKYDRVFKDLRTMRRGLRGNWRSFDHVLDIAYGRRGKLKHELLEPFLSDPNAQVPPPIIPQMSSSRPPVYSPELRALLTSDLSRTTKPLRPSAFDQPPTLPPQFDPSSEEARLFGGLSKRREKNIVQRFFKQEIQKVYPPLEVRLRGGDRLEDVGVRGAGGQGMNLMKDIENIIGPTWKPPKLTRRERKSLIESDTPVQRQVSGQTSRWLRRRYQSLLERIPILTFTPGKKLGGGRYSVERSPKFLGHMYNNGGRLLPVAAASQLAWHECAATQPKTKKGMS